jgi:hypothetical protein
MVSKSLASALSGDSAAKLPYEPELSVPLQSVWAWLIRTSVRTSYRSARLVTKIGKFTKMLKLVRMAKTVQIVDKCVAVLYHCLCLRRSDVRTCPRIGTATSSPLL